MLGHILGGQTHAALPLPLPPAPRLAHPHGPVLLDVLHDPVLPVRNTNAGVVLPRLNHVPGPNGEAVAASGGAAVVHLAPGLSATEAELQDWVRARLAAFKVPVAIRFTSDTLPRNANGKILKKELKALFAERG